VSSTLSFHPKALCQQRRALEDKGAGRGENARETQEDKMRRKEEILKEFDDQKMERIDVAEERKDRMFLEVFLDIRDGLERLGRTIYRQGA